MARLATATGLRAWRKRKRADFPEKIPIYRNAIAGQHYRTKSRRRAPRIRGRRRETGRWKHAIPTASQTLEHIASGTNRATLESTNSRKALHRLRRSRRRAKPEMLQLAPRFRALYQSSHFPPDTTQRVTLCVSPIRRALELTRATLQPIPYCQDTTAALEAQPLIVEFDAPLASVWKLALQLGERSPSVPFSATGFSLSDFHAIYAQRYNANRRNSSQASIARYPLAAAPIGCGTRATLCAACAAFSDSGTMPCAHARHTRVCPAVNAFAATVTRYHSVNSIWLEALAIFRPATWTGYETGRGESQHARQSLHAAPFSSA